MNPLFVDDLFYPSEASRLIRVSCRGTSNYYLMTCIKYSWKLSGSPIGSIDHETSRLS